MLYYVEDKMVLCTEVTAELVASIFQEQLENFKITYLQTEAFIRCTPKLPN